MDNNIYVDTNVLLDILQEREDFVEDSEEFLEVGRRVGNLYISALSFHIVMYVVKPNKKDKNSLKNFLGKFEVVSLNKEVVFNAFSTDFKDYEDILQFNSAVKSCSTIVTRDKKDYKMLASMSNRKVDIYTPKEWLEKNY